MGLDFDFRRPVQEVNEHDEAVLFVHLEDGCNEAIEGAAGQVQLLTRFIGLAGRTMTPST